MSGPGILGNAIHVRRRFYDASKLAKKAGSAEEALAVIARIYCIKSRLRAELEKDTTNRNRFVGQRDEEVTPILEKYHVWLQKRCVRVPPKSALGTAIGYTLGEWPKLVRYLDAWYLTPYNNAAENALRPDVVERNSWLFADTPRGAHASATLYSLVESARANGLEPYHYLRYLFARLPEAIEEKDPLTLLPTSLTPKNLFLP